MAGGFQSSDEEVIGGINITPLVDVVLVLLIIFLITAPSIYQSAIKVQLPRAQSGEANPSSPLQFTLSAAGDVYWNKDKVDWKDLPARLTSTKAQLDQSGADDVARTASIGADEKTGHGVVVKLMDILRQAGFARFALTVDGPGSPAGP